ncbi:MAG TPA: ATP-binding protein [Myxococcota bacterium]|nr:ATP-binding protein [Myxococcota bacterium]
MPNDSLLQQMQALGLRAPKDALEALLVHATKSRLSPVQTLEHLCALLLREREQNNLARRTKLATLGAVPPLDRFDWSHPRSIEKPLYEALLTLGFLKPGHNVLFRGPAGVGKTSLAQNLGLCALQHGFTVRFCTLAAALTDLLKYDSLPAFERRLSRYVKPQLLILDEIGYLPCDNRAADILYNIVTRRHLQRSTVITTNLSFKQWGTLFPGAACIGALIDRFVQHCHVLDIDADSYRQKLSRDFPPDPPSLPAASNRPK